MENHKNKSDEDLVEIIRTNNPDLYRELVERYEEKLLRYASYLTRDQDKASDIVQEAFIKAYINLKGFDTKKKFSSWIYRIVHNEAINNIRETQKEIPFGDKEFDKIDEKQDPENDLIRKEIQETMAACLDNLPLIYREPLALFFLQDKKYEEISDILRIPVSTVGVRIRRGKKIMQNNYKKKGGRYE